MKISFALGADMTALVTSLSASLRNAAASLPPLPAVKDLVALTPDGDFFGGDVTVNIAPAPALVAWCDDIGKQLAACTRKPE